MTFDSDDDPYAEVDHVEAKEGEPQPQSDSDNEEEDGLQNASGSVTSGSPTPEPVTLNDAIRTAPIEQLHSLLMLICEKHESARDLASSRLLAPMASSIGQKRKAFERCQNYGNEYSVFTNDKGDCVYHPGEKEADYESDFWADHDEDCHGRIEDFEDDSTCDGGFQWTCCEKLGDAEGCVRSRHKPEVRESATKKVRYAYPITLQNIEQT